jgi:hypothetical protein
MLVPVIKKLLLDKGADKGADITAREIVTVLQEAVEMNNAEDALVKDLGVMGLGEECTLRVDGLHTFLAKEENTALHKKFAGFVIQQLNFVISLFEIGSVEEALYFLHKVTAPGDGFPKQPCFNFSCSSKYAVLLDIHSALEFESHLAKEAKAGGNANPGREEQLVSQTNQLAKYITYIVKYCTHSKFPPPSALQVLAEEKDGWFVWNRATNVLLPMLLAEGGEFQENDNWILIQLHDRLGNWADNAKGSRLSQACLSALRMLYFIPLALVVYAYAFVYTVVIYETLLAIRLAPSSLYRFFFAPLRPNGWYKRSVANGAYISRFMSVDWTDDHYVGKNHLVENIIPQGGFFPVHSMLLLQRKFFVLAECWFITLLHYADFGTDVAVIIQWYNKGYTGAVAVGIVSLILPIVAIGLLQLVKALDRIEKRKKQRGFYKLLGLPVPPELSGSDNERASFKAIFVDFLASATTLQMLLETVGQLRLEANDESPVGEDAGGVTDLQKFKLIEAILESFPSSTTQLYIMLWEFRNARETEIDWINLLFLAISVGTIAYAVSDQRCRTVGTSNPILRPVMWCQSFCEFSLRSLVIVLFILEFEDTMYPFVLTLGLVGESSEAKYQLVLTSLLVPRTSDDGCILLRPSKGCEYPS